MLVQLLAQLGHNELKCVWPSVLDGATSKIRHDLLWMILRTRPGDISLYDNGKWPESYQKRVNFVYSYSNQIRVQAITRIERTELTAF